MCISYRSKSQLRGCGHRIRLQETRCFGPVAARELSLKEAIRRPGVIEQPSPELVEQPLPLESPLPVNGRLHCREIIQCGDVGLRSDEITPAIVLGSIERNVLADEIRNTPAQSEKILIADHPRNPVVLRSRLEVCVSEYATVDLDQFRGRMSVGPVEYHLYPDRGPELIVQALDGGTGQMLHIRADTRL